MASLQIIPYLNLIIALILPIYFWLTKKDAYLLAWLVFTCATDIVGNQLWFNLSGFKLSGLVLLPFILQKMESFPRNLKKCLAVYIVWNVIRALFEIENGLFPITKQLGTQLSEVSNLLVLIYLLRKESLIKLRETIFIVMCIAIFGGSIERLFSLDLFHFFTGGRELLLENRMRGLSYEPRAFGYSMAVAMVFSLSFLDRKTLILFSLAAIGLAASASISSIALATVGVLLILVTRLKDWRLFLVLVVGGFGVAYIGDWSNVISDKVNFYWKDLSSELSIVEFLIQLNEPAEAAVLNYLKSNPLEFFIGMGPGAQIDLIKPFILERDLGIWGESMPLLPGMGYLLLISNIGIFGFVYYCLNLWLRPLFRIPRESVWKGFCVAIFFMFLLQARNFHVIGLAVVWILVIENQVVIASKNTPQ